MKFEKSEEFVYESDSSSDYDYEKYSPPEHFEKIDIPATNTPLDNKEIWLIKIPKGFPISKLKTLPVSFTATKIDDEGVSKVELEGHKFQVNEDHFSTNTAKYTILRKDLINKRFDRFFTLREVVDLPEIDMGSVMQPRKDVEKIEGLRMRHFPTGYSEKNFKEAKVSESLLDHDGRVFKKSKTGPTLEKSSGMSVEKKKKKKKEKKDKEKKKENKSRSG